MNGVVDSSGRALLPIRLRNPHTGAEAKVHAWIDTGFTGELVLPESSVHSLALPLGPAVRAGLADGSEVDLDTYTCLLEWLGEWLRIEVVANRGQFPLLGVGLLLTSALHVDYRAKTLAVE